MPSGLMSRTAGSPPVGKISSVSLVVSRPGRSSYGAMRQDVIVDVIREVELAGQRGGPDVDHDVDVHGATRIPAGIDACGTRPCPPRRFVWRPRRNVCSGRYCPRGAVVGGDDGRVVWWREARVAAERVALPDLHGGVVHGGAVVAGEADPELQWRRPRGPRRCRVAAVARRGGTGPRPARPTTGRSLQVDSIDASAPVTAITWPTLRTLRRRVVRTRCQVRRS